MNVNEFSNTSFTESYRQRAEIVHCSVFMIFAVVEVISCRLVFSSGRRWQSLCDKYGLYAGRSKTSHGNCEISCWAISSTWYRVTDTFFESSRQVWENTASAQNENLRDAVDSYSQDAADNLLCRGYWKTTSTGSQMSQSSRWLCQK